MRHLFLLQRFSLKDKWVKRIGFTSCWRWKRLPTNPTKNHIFQLLEEWRPSLSEQQSGSSVQEIENVSNVTAKAPTEEQGVLFFSCVPVSVERLDQDKDADENVDPDQTRTGRPVSEQPPGLFTQREELDIDFRVSGLPRAVVKPAGNFRVRELVKKIESHPHREALQAELQQNNTCNPFW